MADPTGTTLTAADVMTANPRTCSAFSSVLEASLLFEDENCGAVPVVDGGRPIGILTDRDVALAVANSPDLGSRPVSEYMSEGLITVAPGDSLAAVVAHFGENRVHRLLVVAADGRLVGIVSWSDLAPHVSEASLGHLVGEVDQRP